MVEPWNRALMAALVTPLADSCRAGDGDEADAAHGHRHSPDLVLVEGLALGLSARQLRHDRLGQHGRSRWGLQKPVSASLRALLPGQHLQGGDLAVPPGHQQVAFTHHPDQHPSTYSAPISPTASSWASRNR
jgi:hypothetical protein